MGRVFERVDISTFQDMTKAVEEYYTEESKYTKNILDSNAYKLVYMSKKYDDWFLDPIVGLIIPGVGDFISSIAAMPALYTAAFKIKSFKLTIAILYITVLDIICGVIPGVGDVVDAFYKSNKKACRWIVGYVEKDRDTISEVKRSATWGSFMLIVIGFLIWALFSVIISIFEWFANLF